MNKTAFRGATAMTDGGLDLAVSVDDGDWTAFGDAPALAERAARAAFAAAFDGGDAEAGLVLTGDGAVRALNRDYRGQDKPTNVLSFAARDGAGPPPPPGQPVQLGDIVIACETTLAEAARDGKTPGDHLSHLAVHGMLHLLGFDHEDETGAERMEAMEVRILASLGIGDPYDGQGN